MILTSRPAMPRGYGVTTTVTINSSAERAATDQRRSNRRSVPVAAGWQRLSTVSTPAAGAVDVRSSSCLADASIVASVRLRPSATRTIAHLERWPMDRSAVASSAHAIRLSTSEKPWVPVTSRMRRDQSKRAALHRRLAQIANCLGNRRISERVGLDAAKTAALASARFGRNCVLT